MATGRTRKTPSIVAQATELAFAVPQVVAHRVTRMALSGPVPSARDRKEFDLMHAEKAAAFGEAWNAMAAQAARSSQGLASSWLQALWSPTLQGRVSVTALAGQMHSAALGVLGVGVRPLHRKAVANAKRLARTRLR